MAKGKDIETGTGADRVLDPDVLKGQPLATALDTIVAAEQARIAEQARVFKRPSSLSPSSSSPTGNTGHLFARSSGPSRPNAVPSPGAGKGTIFTAPEKGTRGTITRAIATIAGPPDDEQPSAKSSPSAEARGVLDRLASIVKGRK